MAASDFEAMYGFVMPATTSSYDDSASPHSDNEDDNNFGQSSEANGGLGEETGDTKRKSRRPPSTAERRATHNAVERARRESLNGRFMELASALPSMANVKRPSKSTIVAKSLEYVYTSEDRERALREENASLRREVDQLRAKLGLPPSAPAILAVRSPVLNEHPRERVGSFDDSTSSIFSASPPTSGTSFGTSPLGTTPALNAGSPNFNAVFGRSAIVESPAPSKVENPSGVPASIMGATQPIPVSGMPFHMGMPSHQMSPYETNYLMALSMQQQQAAVQQQQNALHMAMSGPGNWSAFNFGLGGMNHPSSVGMHDYPTNLVFA